MPPKKPVQKPVARKPVTKAAGNKKPVANKDAPKSNAKPKEPPKPKGPSKEDLATIKIQKDIRRYLAKCQLQKLKQAKIDYENDMKELERQALIAISKREQEEYAKQREKENEIARQKALKKKRIKQILEFSFDDEVDDIKKIIATAIKELPNEGSKNEALVQMTTKEFVTCKDPNNNSALGEAAAGGAINVIKYLIANGANPNHKGQWLRTPLYRSSFAGHEEACQTLLELGADPRMIAEDAQTPVDTAGTDAVRKVFENWDISQTEAIIEENKAKHAKFKELQLKEMQSEMSSIEDIVLQKKEAYEKLKLQLKAAYCDYERRITDHDTAVATGFDKPEITIKAITEAEMHLESTKIKVEKAQEDLSLAEMKLREQKHKQRCFETKTDEDFDYEKDADMLKNNPLIQRHNIKSIPDVIFRDVGNKIKDSGKWPLILDPSGQAGLFLRYQDTNYVNILDTRACQEQKLKTSLLGAIRFGKPLVVDLVNMDLWSAMESSFDRICPNLFEDLLNKSLLDNQNYMKLVDESKDEEIYHKNKFVHGFSDKFRFVILSKFTIPPEEWLDKTYTIEICVEGS